MEEEINDLAIESLALLAPVASDLRKVIGTIKIATELERIGDYAVKDRDLIIKLKGKDVIKRIKYSGKEIKVILK